ncbi:MAG: branched-chain amino acid ABC transporter permease, partial [Planctomycetes bacterium]|nr:branched-chain amino acid ABC transporter permease [Planctomycetota bacterium]
MIVDLLQTIATGLAIGSFYALIALGYTMVYGILQFINFAHSDVFVVGAWLSLILATSFGWAGADGSAAPLWGGPVILVSVMLACGLLGFLIERFAYRPLRGAPRLNVLITAIGVSLFLQNVGQLPQVFATQPQKMPALIGAGEHGTWDFGGVRIGLEDVIGAGTALLLMLALEWLIQRTQTGRAMRAVSYNIPTAALMGIDVNRVISLTFVLGSALAAAAGLLYALKYPVLNQPAYPTWVLLGLKAFV